MTIARATRLALSERAGVTTLEFALVGSLFFIMIFGVVEVGRALWTVNALNYAVQQAARCAALNSTDCPDQTSVRSFATGVSAILVPASSFTLSQYSDFTCATTTATATLVKAKKVSATYSMNLYVPFVSMRPTFTAASCFPTK